MRNESKVAAGYWDYTTLDNKILEDAAKLSEKDLSELARPGFTVKMYDTLESFFCCRGAGIRTYMDAVHRKQSFRHLRSDWPHGTASIRYAVWLCREAREK